MFASDGIAASEEGGMEDRAVHLIAVRFVPLDIDVGILRLEG